MSSQGSSTNSTTVLAQASIDSSELNPRWSPSYKQKIVEFYGFEGEDFRYFRSLLESFFAINGITHDHRKVIILKSQLRRAAAVFFSNDLKSKDLSVDKVNYPEAIKVLQDRFLSKDLLEEYEFAFQAMKQTSIESPQMYLSRLYEAADLADIQDDKMFFSRFRAGLLPPIITFCKEQAATAHKEWVKNANAWWSAHATRPIHLVDNPFISGDYSNGNNGIKFSSEKTKNDTMVSLKSNNIINNHKSQTEAYADAISPSIASLTAKLEALELHSLIPGNGSNGKNENDTLQTSTIKSLLSDNEFKSFIKNIVQEVNNEKVTSYIPYKNNRRPFYNNENYNNDQNYKNYPYTKNYRNNNNPNAMNDNNNYNHSQNQNEQQQQQRYNNTNQNNQHYNNNNRNFQNRGNNNYNQQGPSTAPPNNNHNGQQQRQNYNQSNFNNRNNYQNDNHQKN